MRTEKILFLWLDIATLSFLGTMGNLRTALSMLNVGRKHTVHHLTLATDWSVGISMSDPTTAGTIYLIPPLVKDSISYSHNNDNGQQPAILVFDLKIEKFRFDVGRWVCTEFSYWPYCASVVRRAYLSCGISKEHSSSDGFLPPLARKFGCSAMQHGYF